MNMLKTDIINALRSEYDYLMELLETERKCCEHFAWKYQSKDYYEYVIRLNKIRNLLKYLFK